MSHQPRWWWWCNQINWIWRVRPIPNTIRLPFLACGRRMACCSCGKKMYSSSSSNSGSSGSICCRGCRSALNGRELLDKSRAYQKPTTACRDWKYKVILRFRSSFHVVSGRGKKICLSKLSIPEAQSLRYWVSSCTQVSLVSQCCLHLRSFAPLQTPCKLKT